MPSSLARRRAMANASLLLIWITSSSTSVCRFCGMKPAPMPWILCGPGLPPLITGESTGSTATHWKDGFFCLIISPTPVIVPPVPTPATSASHWPSVSSQISTAVVRRWISGLAGFINCCGIRALRFCFTRYSALRIAPGIPSGPGVRTNSAPSIRNKVRRSTLIVSGIVRINRYPLAAQTNASAMPVLPEVGSTITVSASMSPARSAASIIETPIRSFTELNGLKNSHLIRIWAFTPSVTRLSRTSGVPPMVFVMSS